MAAYRTERTDEELEDMAVADAITSFLAVKQRNWIRHQKNRILPRVMIQLDAARAAGHKPNIPKIIEDAFARDTIPLPELT